MEPIFIQPWHWLVVAILLLTLEIMGAGGFVLGMAIAALLQSIIAVSFDDLSWSFQLLTFAINSIIFTVIYWKFFRKFNNRTDAPELNDRAAQFVGRSFMLQKSLVHGEGREQLGDSLWRIRCDENLPAESSVTVIGTEGMVLLVKKAD